MKYATKRELLDDIRESFAGFSELLEGVPRSRLKEAGVWGDDWNVVDLVAHLWEWHIMFLRWYEDGLAGKDPALPAPGYKWNQTPALNRAIREKHCDREFDEVWARFTTTHDRILNLAEDLSERELLDPGHFPWTGKNSLVTYMGPNTASHYRFGIKVLKRWKKGKRKAGS